MFECVSLDSSNAYSNDYSSGLILLHFTTITNLLIYFTRFIVGECQTYHAVPQLVQDEHLSSRNSFQIKHYNNKHLTPPICQEEVSFTVSQYTPLGLTLGTTHVTMHNFLMTPRQIIWALQTNMFFRGIWDICHSNGGEAHHTQNVSFLALFWTLFQNFHQILVQKRDFLCISRLNFNENPKVSKYMWRKNYYYCYQIISSRYFLSTISLNRYWKEKGVGVRFIPFFTAKVWFSKTEIVIVKASIKIVYTLY